MHSRMKMMTATASLATALLLLGGCTTNMGSTASLAGQETAIDNGVDATLATLYSSVPGSQELARKASGILVFPRVVAAGLVVGGEHGRGALQVGGQTVGYYQTTALSLGLQAGAESKGVVFMFMTQDALDRFRSGNGWTAGVDASVAVLKAGANGMLDTTSGAAAVNAFALTNSGLMAAANVEGTRVSKLDLPVPMR